MPQENSSQASQRARSTLGSWLLLLAWLGAALLSTWYAFGWKTDNRLEHWVGQIAEDPGYGVLVERFGGDEAILVRVDQWSIEESDATSFLLGMGKELEALPGILALLDPLHLPGSKTSAQTGISIEKLEALAARPLVEALGLIEARVPRIDFLLQVDPKARPETRAQLASQISILRQAAAQSGLRLRAAGHPLVATALDFESKRVERIFAPLLALFAGLGIALYLRSLRLAGFVLLPAILASSLCRAGLRFWGIDSDLILVSSGPLTFVLGLACSLHLVCSYRRLSAQGHPAPQAASLARQEKWKAALLSGVTTAVGFGVFTISGLQSVGTLGLAVALTTLAIMPLIYLLLVPLLASFGPASKRSLEPAGRRFQRWAQWALRRRTGVLGLGGALCLLGILAPWQLPQETNALHYFPKGHALRSSFAALESEGAALSSLEILLARKSGEPWLKTGAALGPSSDAGPLLGPRSQAFREGLERVQGVRAIFDPACIAQELNASVGSLGALALPTSLHLAGRLDSSGQWLRWTVQFLNGDSAHVSEIVESVRAQAQGLAQEYDAELQITGSVPLMLEMQSRLLGTLASSLAYTALFTSLLLLWVARRPRILLAAVLTNLAPVCLTLASAWALGMALDGATVMVSAVVLGLAVDNTFHLLHAAGPAPSTRAILRAFRAVGEAASTSSLALGLGFLSLTLSGFAPTASFGLLCSLGSLAALSSDLILFPALWLKPKRTRVETPATQRSLITKID